MKAGTLYLASVGLLGLVFAVGSVFGQGAGQRGPGGLGAGAPGGAGGRGGAAPGGAPPAGGPPRGGAAPGPLPTKEVTITAIPGVIAADAKWKLAYTSEIGNNGDGIVAGLDGNLLIGQNDASQVIKLDKDDKATVLLKDTGSAGALALDGKGRLYGIQRDTDDRGILQLQPERKFLANTFNGQPMKALGRLNDLIVDKNGGAYFTSGQAYYISPKGEVTQISTDLRTNGIVLSPDEKVLYITNGQTVVAYDVQADGKASNRRDFCRLQAAGADGMAVDVAGRLYVTNGDGVNVFASDGKALGIIPTPKTAISVALAGADRKMLYFVAPGATGSRAAEIYKIPILAEGLKNRGK